MIAYLEGTVLKKNNDRIILLANQIGYEVLLPAVIKRSVYLVAEGDLLSLYIYYHQTDRQPKPVLIGFHTEEEKAFFQLLISVEAIGPLKAAQAMTIPITEIAGAIESKDTNALKQLNGIGLRTAQKIIATLAGKMDRFVLRDNSAGTPEEKNSADNDSFGADWTKPTRMVLIEQLGYKPAEARQLIQNVLTQNKTITTPETLFDEIFRQH